MFGGCRVQQGGGRLGLSSHISEGDRNLEKEVTAIAQGNVLLGNTFSLGFLSPVEVVPLYIES